MLALSYLGSAIGMLLIVGFYILVITFCIRIFRRIAWFILGAPPSGTKVMQKGS